MKQYLECLANWSTLSDDRQEEYRLNHQDYISGSASKNARAIRMERTTNLGRTNLPTSHQVIQVVTKAMLQQLLKTTNVDASKLFLINGFISAYICLCHAQRPSLAAEMRLAEFQVATSTFRSDDSVSYTVLVALGKSSDLLLVNRMGKDLGEQIPELISRLHKKVGLTRTYTNRDAHRSVETWCQNLSVNDRVAEFIAHSEKTSNQQYTAHERVKAAEIGFLFEQLQTMTAKVSTNVKIFP